MTSYGEIKTMKRNVLLIPHLCLYSQKDFQQDVGHSADKGSPEGQMWIDSTDKESDQIRRNADIEFSLNCHDVHFLEEGGPQKQRTVENYLYTSVPMVIRLKLFFAQ